MTVTAVYGPATQLAIDNQASLAALTKRYNFIDAGIVNQQHLEDMNALRGTLAHSKEATRPGVQRIRGNIRLTPTAVELSNLLAWMMNGTVSGTSYPLADATLTRGVGIDRSNNLFGGTDGKCFFYPSCAVNKWTLKAAKGGLPLELDLDVVGLTETVSNYNTFPTLSLDITSKPFLFTDLVLSVGGTACSAEDVELSCDYKIDTERFFNSLTLTGTYATDQIITCKTHVPWAGAEAAYNAGASGVACTLVFTNAQDNTKILTFTAGTAIYTMETPPIRGHGELLLPISMQFFKSSSTPALATTLATS